ncbi:MAG: DUF4360 domain-containing protein [Bdellovibrionales bacterium]|nr:DUF4360 domain-containing protein [Bdellovibrionales bacterium]
MKIGMKVCLAALASVSLISVAQADDIRLGRPGYGGNGCPGGSASVTLSPDRKSLSILFDSYVAEAGGDTNKRLDRKSCNIAIPVHVPQGYSVSIFRVDYRGYAYVPHGAEARFNAEYFFAGVRGPTTQRNFSGFVDDNYLLTNNIVGQSLVWSQCGADVNLRVNTSMVARTNGRSDQVLATVDSTDVRSGLIYHVQWRRCH